MAKFNISEFSKGIRTAEAQAQQPERPSDWQHRCAAHGCPLTPSASFGGHQLCAFHHGEDVKFYPAVTQAIRSMSGTISRYFEMVQWSAAEWNITPENERGQPMRIGKAVHLTTWDFHPYGGSQPSQYLTELGRKIHTEIKRRASEIYQQGDAA